MLDIPTHSEDCGDFGQRAAAEHGMAPSIDAVRAKLSQRAALLRGEARFAICGKREQLAELARLLDDSARLLKQLSR